MPHTIALIFLATCLATAVELPLTGTWVDAKPVIAADATVVVAVFDRTGTCCGGPAAALSGLVGLRASLADRAGIVVLAVDSTPGVTVETAKTAAAAFGIADFPLLVDPERTTGNALGADTGVTINYVVVKPDGSRFACMAPAKVRRELAP